MLLNFPIEFHRDVLDTFLFAFYFQGCATVVKLMVVKIDTFCISTTTPRKYLNL